MAKDIVIQFGKHIRELRLEREFTQEELASRSKISLKYIQKIEGRNPPNLGLVALQKLANGFDVPLWRLLKF
ncbi:MAG: helix-turn-helix transcriptional regulator [Candidatus Gracilibacteria bacterium]